MTTREKVDQLFFGHGLAYETVCDILALHREVEVTMEMTAQGRKFIIEAEGIDPLILFVKDIMDPRRVRALLLERGVALPPLDDDDCAVLAAALLRVVKENQEAEKAEQLEVSP